LGKTGLHVSAIGLGGHEYRWLHAGNIIKSRHLHFNPKRSCLVARARDSGINFFDTTYQEEVQSLGHILHKTGGRDGIVINGMIIDLLKQVKGLPTTERKNLILSELDIRLELLGSDYFDIFMLCNIEMAYDPKLAMEAMEIYSAEKEKGKLRYIGVSGHDYDRFLDFLALDPPIDVVMFPYNYYRAHEPGSSLERLLGEVQRKDLGLIAIKPLCWSVYGVPFTAINAEWHDIQQLVKTAFSWQVQKGAVHTSVVGVETVREFESILSGAEADSFEKENEALLDPYLTHYEDLAMLIRNGMKHPLEIQSRIVTHLKNKGIDFGESLEAYQQVSAPITRSTGSIWGE